MSHNRDNATQDTQMTDAVVVGAGFAGLYMLHTLRQMGLSAVGIEAGSDVGGTWYWNRYPGARCDAESALYSFSFSDELQQEWHWSEKYATQPEILRYLQHVADRFDLRSDIRFDTRVVSATYDEDVAVWHVVTDKGDLIDARYCIMATGSLSVGRVPEFEGLAETTLPWYHTGAWPHEGVDFTGKRVGIVGTGSSGIQLIPEIARQADEVVVYQRTPSFSVPARNHAVTPAEVERLKANYAEVRRAWRIGQLMGGGEELVPGNVYRRSVLAGDATPEEREAEYAMRWNRGGASFLGAFGDLLVNQQANDTAADFIRTKIREIVEDETTADALIPSGYPVGTKRLCVDTDYYDTYNRTNVSLVDLRRDPILEITPDGLRTQSGEHKFDALVFATGFDAMTGALSKMQISGRGGRLLTDHWKDGPTTYLGVAIAGFPNLFMVTGPGSPSVLGNVVNHIEQHVEFIRDLLVDSESARVLAIEADAAAEHSWTNHVTTIAQGTLYPQAASWYMGANVPGKTRIFMPYVGGIAAYRKHCEQVAADGYPGFVRHRKDREQVAADGYPGFVRA